MRKTIIRNTTYEEYHEAVEEGVEFIFHSAIEEIFDDGENQSPNLKSTVLNLYLIQMAAEHSLSRSRVEILRLNVTTLSPQFRRHLDTQTAFRMNGILK